MEWLNTASEILKALGFGHITLVSLILVIFCPVSLLYALGRGLNILNGRLAKNGFALSLVVILSIAEIFNLMPSKLQSVLFLISMGCFTYVVFWQKFYSRMSNKLTKVLGEDEEENDNGFIIKKRKKTPLK